jgi:hypothetical protein
VARDVAARAATMPHASTHKHSSLHVAQVRKLIPARNVTASWTTRPYADVDSRSVIPYRGIHARTSRHGVRVVRGYLAARLSSPVAAMFQTDSGRVIRFQNACDASLLGPHDTLL